MFVLLRPCSVDHHNWNPEQAPMPIHVAIYDEEGTLKEKTLVKNQKAIIIGKNGSTIPAKVKTSIFGKYQMKRFINCFYFIMIPIFFHHIIILSSQF